MKIIYQKIKVLITLFVLLYTPAILAGQWYLNADVGGGVSNVGKTQTLTLFTYLSPSITDTYTSDNNTSFTGMVGLGGGYRFNIKQKWLLAVGGEASYLNYSDVMGVVHPLVNVAPDFDILNYKYSVNSYLLMINPTLFFFATDRWHPFVTVGLGVAWNVLSDYTESTPPGSTAGHAINPFRNNTQTSFAYAPGIGIEYAINQHYGVQARYQYINTGNGEFNTIINQNTGQHLQSGSLSSHFLIVSLLLGR